MMSKKIPACKLSFQLYCTTRVISLHTKLRTTLQLNDWPVAKVNESTKYSCPRKFKIPASKIVQLVEEEASFDWSFDLRELLLCLSPAFSLSRRNNFPLHAPAISPQISTFDFTL